MSRARIYRCIKMRRWVERSNDTETLPLRPFCRGCIIATREYDFRKGQGISSQDLEAAAEGNLIGNMLQALEAAEFRQIYRDQLADQEED